MIAYTLTVTLRQPAQISDRARSDFVLGTLPYLPGAVVRGAFAARWLSRNGATSAGSSQRHEFETLFEGGIRFGPLFTGPPPMPLSVLRHKYTATNDCPYIAVDLAYGEWDETGCRTCGSPWEAAKGNVDDPGIHRRTHVTITDTGVAARGGLVSRETLPAGSVFTGTIVLDDIASIDILMALAPIRVGGRRTTHGLADVTIAPAGGNTMPAPTALPDGRIVATLRSPGLFIDDLGRPSPDPHPADLAAAFGHAVGVVRRWTRWTTIGGWHIASGLPKPVEHAVTAGTTYLLQPDQPITDTGLLVAASRGLGLRRHEGYGDIGGAAAIPPGLIARDTEQRRVSNLAESVAALGGLKVSRAWPRIEEELHKAVRHDTAATALLRRISESWKPYQREAFERFLAIDPDDAEQILNSWR